MNQITVTFSLSDQLLAKILSFLQPQQDPAMAAMAQLLGASIQEPPEDTPPKERSKVGFKIK